MTDVPADLVSVDLASAEHYEWGVGSEGWRLLALRNLSVIQERVPPGTGEVRHLHVWTSQFFYVLSGVATLEYGQKQLQFAAGQGVHVPNGVEHRFANKSDLDVVFLVISTGPTKDDRVNVDCA